MNDNFRTHYNSKVHFEEHPETIFRMVDIKTRTILNSELEQLFDNQQF